MAIYTMPASPVSGIAVDARTITWRQNAEGTWDPDPCPTCATQLAGGLTWGQLLQQYGSLTDPV